MARTKTPAEVLREALAGSNVAPLPKAKKALPAPVETADGHELELLDSLLPTLHPRARAGDQVAIDQLVRVLDLRLKYKRQRRAEED